MTQPLKVLLTFVTLLLTVTSDITLNDTLSEQLLGAVDGKVAKDKYENAFKIGEKIAACLRTQNENVRIP